MNNNFATEKARSVYLQILRKIWIVPVCGAVTALLFGLIYTGVIVTAHGQRQYTQTSTFYLDFAQNENTQTAYDYYNAATWDGLLYTHPGIFETIERELPAGMTLEEADEATGADLVSDIRVLTVDVTTSDKETTSGLSKAIQDGLISFGESAKEFDQITFLSATEPTLIVVSDRTRNAVLLGAVLGILFSYLLLRLTILLGDAIHTPEEAAERFVLPVLGVQGDAKVPAFLQKELSENLSRIGLSDLSGNDEITVLTADGDRPVSEEGKVIIAIPFGKRGVGTKLQHDLTGMKNAGNAQILGLVITGADGAFLQRYYSVTAKINVAAQTEKK